MIENRQIMEKVGDEYYAMGSSGGGRSLIREEYEEASIEHALKHIYGSVTDLGNAMPLRYREKLKFRRIILDLVKVGIRAENPDSELVKRIEQAQINAE